MGIEKNRLNETVLLSTQNRCLKILVRKYLQFYTGNISLSKSLIAPPVGITSRWFVCLSRCFTSQSTIYQSFWEVFLVKPEKGSIVLLKETTQCLWCGDNPQPLNLLSSIPPLSHCAPHKEMKDLIYYDMANRTYNGTELYIHENSLHYFSFFWFPYTLIRLKSNLSFIFENTVDPVQLACDKTIWSGPSLMWKAS